jgi:hypothetical protein
MNRSKNQEDSRIILDTEDKSRIVKGLILIFIFYNIGKNILKKSSRP